MAHSESREPEDSQAAETADAGEMKRQADQAMASREIGPPADYDAREENKSTRRKSMGPPLDDGEAVADEAREGFRDEDPVDPA